MNSPNTLANLLSQTSRGSVDAMRQVHEMTLDHSLRDYEWTTEEVYTPLFETILKVCDERNILRHVLDDFLETDGEFMLWRVWKYMLESPNEFVDKLAADSSVLGEKFVVCVLERLVSLSMKGLKLSELSEQKKNFRIGAVFVGREAGGGLAHDGPVGDVSVDEKKLAEKKRSVETCSIACKFTLHWLYRYRVDLREFMRIEMAKKLRHIGPSSTLAVKVSAAPLIKAGIGKDAGGSRLHVKPLLELLHSIIGGLSPVQRVSECTNVTVHRLLTSLLLPLHAPSEYIEWRDQTPVIAQYHEILVKCILRLIDVEKRSGLPYSPSSVAVESVRGLVRIWPQGKDANTPKEVLFLHEIETIISHLYPLTNADNSHSHYQMQDSTSKAESNTTREMQVTLARLLYQDVLTVMVRGIQGAGGDAEVGANIRPAQRTLQMFRNKKILGFLGLIYEAALDTLLPVLFPSHPVDSGKTGRGALSWNPTVNKMTGLSLIALRNIDPNTFDRVCDVMFTTRSRRDVDTVADAKGGDINRRGNDVKEITIDDQGSRIELLEESGEKSDRASLCRMPAMKEAEDEDEGELGDVGGIAGIVTRHIPSEEKNQLAKARERDRLAMPPPLRMPSLQRQSQGRVPKRPFNPATVMPGSMRPQEPQAHFIRASGGGPMMNRTGMQRSTVDISRVTAQSTGQMKRESPPPLTVTGVAPWSIPDRSMSDTAQAKQYDALENASSSRASSSVKPMDNKHEVHKKNEMIKKSITGGEGSQCLLAFITECLGRGESISEADNNNKGVWNLDQAAESPTLLPSLTFFDLVFGYQVLGKGAFSTVKYARKISPSTSQSTWTEFAVKIIDSAKLEELHYYKEVEREMAILRLMAHPGVCRLISSFQYKNNAYLVLEYCSRGDLHQLIVRKGALSAYHTRFVIGEVSAAIAYVHDRGFSFNDLKPENVLITELGHIKVADFGACRPVSVNGKKALYNSWVALADLRNGDWRNRDGVGIKADNAQTRNSTQAIGAAARTDGDHEVWTFGLEMHEGEESPHVAASMGAVGGEDDGMHVDGGLSARVEGTPAYLPPEVINSDSARPSYPSDSWALGCVLVFCLSGRPLFYGPRQLVIDQQRYHFGAQLYETALGASGQTNLRYGDEKVVQFNASDNSIDSSNIHGLWSQGGPLQKSLVNALLCLDPDSRLSIRGACDHPFLVVGDGDSESERHSTDCDSDNGRLEPRSLHLHREPPVKIPLLRGRHQGSSDTTGTEDSLDAPNGAEGCGEDDAQWARRQFSVLWAPMPSNYDAEQAVVPGVDRPGKAAGGEVPYKLSYIEETELERDCPFVSITAALIPP